MKYFLLFLMICLSLSCADNSVEPQSDYDYHGYFILNEGGFNQGNSSIDFYNYFTKEYHSSVFAEVNGYPLGDVAQSMLEVDNSYLYGNQSTNGPELLIAVNNSGKIEVLDRLNLKVKQTISDLTSPRYMLISGQKLVVTDLFSNALTQFDRSSYQRSNDISTNGWTEGMLSYFGLVFVSQVNSEYLLVLDDERSEPGNYLQNDSLMLVDSIKVGFGAKEIVAASNQKIWVLSSYQNEDFTEFWGSILRIDLQDNNAIEHRIDLNDGTPSYLHRDEDEILFLYQGKLWKLHENDEVLPAEAFIEPDFIPYGFSLLHHSIYLTDAKDFNQRGEVHLYHSGDGSWYNSWEAWCSTFKSVLVKQAVAQEHT